jgi:hypothetical protein
MRKFRIVELKNRFYPQEKRWYGWRYIDHCFGEFTWNESDKDRSECESFEYANRCIERRKDWLSGIYAKPIYHEIL